MTDRLEFRLREQLLAFVADRSGVEWRISDLLQAMFPAEAAALSPSTQSRHLEALHGRQSARSNGHAPSWLQSLLRLPARPAPLPRVRWHWAAAFVAASILLVLLVLNLPGRTKRDTIAGRPPKTTQPGALTPNNQRPKGPIVQIKTHAGPLQPLKDQIVHHKLAPHLEPNGERKPDEMFAAKVEVGKFGAVTGEPTFRLPGGGASKVLPNGPLYAGATIETGDMDKAEIVFADGTTVAMDFNTTVLLPEQTGQIGQMSPIRPEEITVTSGRVSVAAIHAEGSSFAVKTPVATATVVGTRFNLGLRRAGKELKAVLQVQEGKVEFSNDHGSVLAGANTESSATRTLAPSTPKRLAVLLERRGPRNTMIWEGEPRTGDEKKFAPRFVFHMGYAGFGTATLPDGSVVVDSLASGKLHARAAGMRVGDIVLALNGRPIGKEADLLRWIWVHPDSWIALTVRREGQVLPIGFRVSGGLPSESFMGSREFLNRLYAATAPALTGSPGQAVAMLDKLARREPLASVFNNLGLAQHMQDDMAGAIRSLQAAVRLAPREGLCHFNLGWALLAIGNIDRGIEELQKGISLAPKNHEAARELSIVLIAAGRGEEAIALLTPYTKDETYPHWADLAEALFDQGRYLEGVSAAEKAVRLFPDYWKGYEFLGDALASLGRIAEAESALTKALALNPGNYVAWGRLGTLYRHSGRMIEAAAAFRRSLLLRPDSPVALANLGSVLCDLGQLPEAEALLRKAVALDPGSSECHYRLGRMLRAKREFSEAEKELRQAIQIDPEVSDFQNDLAILMTQTGRLQEAEGFFRRAVELKPDSLSYTNLGLAQQQLGRIEEAAASYWKAIELGVNSSQAHYNLGMLLSGLGRMEEAEKSFRRASELDPKSAATFDWLGIVLEKLGKRDEAIQAYRRAVDLIPAHAARSRLLNLLSPDEAEEEIRRAVALLPNDPATLNALADYLATRGIKLDTALGFSRRAVELAPSHPYWVATLGQIEYLRGEYDEAEKHSLKAIELSGKDPVAAVFWTDLAKVYEKKNLIEKAKGAYRKALLLQPANKEAAEALKRIGGSEKPT